jgi:hypothetical protein
MVPRHPRLLERRTKEGLSRKDIMLCLKRYIARAVYHAIQADLAALNNGEPTPKGLDLSIGPLRHRRWSPCPPVPTGAVLAPRRRRALLDWTAGGGLSVEDDYDAEYRYDRAPIPALQASAPDQVAHTGSTSKTLPGVCAWAG